MILSQDKTSQHPPIPTSSDRLAVLAVRCRIMGPIMDYYTATLADWAKRRIDIPERSLRAWEAWVEDCEKNQGRPPT